MAARLPPPGTIERSVMAAAVAAGLDRARDGALVWAAREPARILDTLRRQQSGAGVTVDTAGSVTAAARQLLAALDAAGLTPRAAARLGPTGDNDDGPLAELIRIATTPGGDPPNPDPADVG